MTQKFKMTAKVISQTKLAQDIYSLWLESPAIAEVAKVGQFIGMYPNDATKMLMRPISLCEIDQAKGALRVVYRVTSSQSGTAQFAKLTSGEKLEIFGPLGNGFEVTPALGKTAMLFGGGIGIPPMLELGKQLAKQGVKCLFVLGYRDEVFLNEEFEQYGDVYLASESGAYGTKGNVLDAVQEQNLQADIMYACGPTPMLKALQTLAAKSKTPCYLSLEERMACGIGACLACVCRSVEVDGHSHVKNKRVCKDGPVFLATEVEL